MLWWEANLFFFSLRAETLVALVLLVLLFESHRKECLGVCFTPPSKLCRWRRKVRKEKKQRKKEPGVGTSEELLSFFSFLILSFVGAGGEVAPSVCGAGGTNGKRGKGELGRRLQVL